MADFCLCFLSQLGMDPRAFVRPLGCTVGQNLVKWVSSWFSSEQDCFSLDQIKIYAVETGLHGFQSYAQLDRFMDILVLHVGGNELGIQPFCKLMWYIKHDLL